MLVIQNYDVVTVLNYYRGLFDGIA